MRVTILSGIPGSGKSTWAKAQVRLGVRICSADYFFMSGGEYRFDPSKLSEAHGQCLRDFLDGIAAGPEHLDHIIVDNTNISLIELAPYVQVALAYGHEVEVRTFWASPTEAAEKCVHDVPFQTVARMNKNLVQRIIPGFWNVRVVNTYYDQPRFIQREITKQ